MYLFFFFFLPFFVYEILGKILGLFSHPLNGLVVRIRRTSETLGRVCIVNVIPEHPAVLSYDWFPLSV